ncbi:16S rRNA (cytosine1407-C5)-methyltransferase [Chitinivorax tropicus]|uniref:16S rRNA (Cytosine1407-C5)-methyltransferase n=1 Tax=Chitinivorax tropicus TaxID=714531 RepID=A0A840MRM8_9PROT|nr:RsmB/NOP family class I SAM-dependent RNA methyltransferase [Chitinivorax tropicus]MBB5019767.1 16S rRNA (cytosine1407-C5)-methyltransferase [Chitinivorax tropicus]
MNTVLPAIFVERLQRIVPPERLETVLASFSQPAPTVFRVNTLKTTPTQLCETLQAAGLTPAPIDWQPTAYFVPATQRRALTETSAFYDGWIYVQNLASQLAPIILAPSPGETVLDLAAAPGGKTCQLAALMQNQGVLSAVEPVKDRFFRLKANLQQQGVTIARTYMTDGRSVGAKCPEMFDKVLLDAPCSSEARFDALDSDSVAHWSLQKVKEVSHKQKRLLNAAIHSLKPGGTLVYSTCSFSPEENEKIIEAQLKSFGDAIEILPIELPIDNWQAGLPEWEGKAFHPRVTLARRILPNAWMDGFFLCKLKKLRSV